jgi:hypothetical protein
MVREVGGRPAMADVLACEIEGIGRLANLVVAAG